MDLIAPMLHKKEKVTEIVGILNGVTQIRFQHGTERRLALFLTHIIGNIMLLVPGVAFVNALRDMIGGDMMSGILRVCESILLAVFLAAGSFMALMFLGGVL